MELREYQKDLLDRLFQAYHDGYQAPCIVLPCGGLCASQGLFGI